MMIYMDNNGVDSDDILIKKCLERDNGAWAEFSNRFSGLITTSIGIRLKKCGLKLDRQDIEDIRQDVLVSIWDGRKLESIHNAGSLKYWLSIISGNEAISYARKMRTFGFGQFKPAQNEDNDMQFMDTIAAETPQAANEDARSRRVDRIDEAIASLSDKEQLVIKLSICHGRKFHEIASILSMPIGTVSSYAKRAKEKIRDFLT
jgi:RNA polymerase sigma-70 factor, ECF subfamily